MSASSHTLRLRSSSWQARNLFVAKDQFCLFIYQVVSYNGNVVALSLMLTPKTISSVSPLSGLRLSQEFPYIEAEVKYAVREYACTAVDVLARRTRLAFLNVQAAHEALPRIMEIMAAELGWDKNRKKVGVSSSLCNDGGTMYPSALFVLASLCAVEPVYRLVQLINDT